MEVFCRFFFHADDGMRFSVASRGLGDVYNSQFLSPAFVPCFCPLLLSPAFATAFATAFDYSGVKLAPAFNTLLSLGKN